MTTTLNLFDHLLSMGKKYQELGRTLDALRVLTRLAGLREMPGEVAEECQVRLGEMQLKRRRFRRARRHLTAALQHAPEQARTHHLLAQAYLGDGRGDQQRAEEHFRRSLELDDTQVACLVDAGLLAIKLGQCEEGLGWLRRAAELAPDDWQVIGKLARGLRLTGHAEEGRKILRFALFRNPRSPRFRKLWTDCQFQLLRQEQERQRLEQEAHVENEEGAVILAFRPRDEFPEQVAVPEGTRLEGATSLPGPHSPWSIRLSDQQNVQ